MDTRVQHDIVGHFNPHCARCGLSVMQIQWSPSARCERMTLPFEDLPLLPIKAGLRPAKERAS